MRIVPSFLLCLVLISSCKKNPGIEVPPTEPIPHNKALTWDKKYGGTNYDFINATVQLADGSVVGAGASRSIDGDIGGSRFGFDNWLVKLDNSGAKVWSVTNGNNFDDYSTAIINTPDGGFLVAGYSFDNFRNFSWVYKTDATGNKQWEKSLSTGTDAKPFSIISSGDGNFMIAGYETIARGDKQGVVTKINAAGEILWSKNFGGSNEDQFSSIVKLQDGGFAASGFSKSSNEDLIENRGNFDGWIVKIDAAGTKVWSRSWGGTDEDYFKSVVAAADGGIATAGFTRSTAGDIITNRGGNEAWVMKFDGSGAKQWSKNYGGANEEYISSIVNTNDGGYMIVGHTNSTTWDVKRQNNDFGCWIVKLDAAGGKAATSTYGNRDDEFINTLIPTSDGGYLIGGYQFVDGRGYDGLMIKIGSL